MSALRKRTLTVLLITGAVLGLSTAVVYAGTRGGHASGSKGASTHGSRHHHRHGKAGNHGFPPNVQRVDLSGYKIEASYTLGRNTANTFQQTYTATSVQGVPVAGPSVGATFLPEDYVALPIAHQTLYIAWLDPATHAIVDAFVMNFATHVVFDYAPGSAQPESSGTVKVITAGPNRIP
jgi:hypothetical protein